MKNRDKYEIVYRQLCWALGKTIPDFRVILDGELLNQMNVMLSALNCELLTLNEIVKAIKA